MGVVIYFINTAMPPLESKIMQYTYLAGVVAVGIAVYFAIAFCQS